MLASILVAQISTGITAIDLLLLNIPPLIFGLTVLVPLRGRCRRFMSTDEAIDFGCLGLGSEAMVFNRPLVIAGAATGIILTAGAVIDKHSNK
jgi:hypothetical protein